MSSGRSFLRGYKAWVAPQTNGGKQHICIVVDVVEDIIEAIVDDITNNFNFTNNFTNLLNDKREFP